MNLANLLHRMARVSPDREAVALGTRTLSSYGDLARRTGALARQLHVRFGLSDGDRVGIFMRNCPEYLETLYAIWTAGMVAVPINNKLHPAEAAYILEDSAASIVFASGKLATGLSSVGAAMASLPIIDVDTAEYATLLHGQPMTVASRRSEDLAWLFYTSGTTGKPKGVLLTHGNLMTMTLCYFSDVDTAKAEDSILYAAPMSHGAGMYSMAHMLVGARHVVPESGAFQPDEILTLSKRFRNISMFAAPTMVRRMVEHCESSGEDPSGIKTIVYGGGPMYVEDIRRGLEVMGNRFVQIYGQGESPMTITALSRFQLGNISHPRYLERIGSVGVAQSAVEVRIGDQQGNSVADGLVGEILVRGATVMGGYWNRPEATAEALRDGWLFTGDMGVLDADGFLTLKDRSKDVIISGGSNVYPREVEEALLSHPSVAEVSVVGRPNPEWGEDVVAFVVTSPGTALDPQQLDAHCLSQIARFKRPKEYILLDALPKNNYGKVLKTELRTKLDRSQTP